MQRLTDYALSLLRLFAGWDAVATFYNAMQDANSHVYQVAQTPDGAFLFWLLGAVGIAVMLDVILNDWTPKSIRIGKLVYKISWQKAFRKRHFLFVALAFCYAAQPYVADKGGHSVSLLLTFYGNALQNIIIAFFDARQRSRSQVWQRLPS